MSRLATIAIAGVVGSLCACDDAANTGPSVAVQRFDEEGSCWVTLTPEGSISSDVVGSDCLGASSTQSSGGAAGGGAPDGVPDTRLVAGADRIRVVVDYGTNVPFQRDAVIPTPTLNVALDGAVETVAATFVQIKTVSRGVFEASFVVPQTTAKTLTVGATVRAGFAATAEGAFLVTQPQLDVTLRNCATIPETGSNGEGGASDDADGDGGAPPADGEACEFYSGVDTAEVRVVAQSATPRDVTLVTVLGGLTQSQIPVRVAEPTRLGGRRGVAATVPLVAPVVGSAMTWRVFALLGASSHPGATSKVLVPPVFIDLEGCDQGPCERTSLVGSEAITVTTLGTTAKKADITWRVNGSTQQERRTITLDRRGNLKGRETVSGTDFIATPAAADGARWELKATVDGVTVTAPELVLRPPQIMLELACQDDCNLIPGKMIAVRIGAPLGILARQARLTTTVGGALDVVDAVVNLTEEDFTTNQLVGVTSLPIPDAAGQTWKLDATLGGFRAESVIVPITASPESPP